MLAGPGVGQLGMELRSWFRFGVFPQSVATSLLLVTLGLGWRAIRTGRRLVMTGAMLGLTMLAHLIYGWMGALSICLMALLPDAGIPRRPRILRTLQVGLVSAALCAFQLLPIFTDGYRINRSRVEQVEKYDSHGAAKVLGWLFSGRILDNDRIPALSLLALAGAAFWILVFFGRPTWGILLVLLGVTPDLQLHRVIAGVQIFLLFLAAMALAELWRQAARRWHPIAAVRVDGQPVKTAMLTPGFLGVPVTAGKHEIVCRYEPGNAKILMAVAGLAVVLLLGVVEWRRSAIAP